MTREQWMKKLEAIIARIESGEARARIREFYVFGSFARGAPEPNDLDLIVVHDRPGVDVLVPELKDARPYSPDDVQEIFKAERRFNSAVRKVFRRGSEPMDLMLAGSLDEALGGLISIPREEVRLVWSETDRNWEANLAAIPTDASAGSHPRDHFIDVKKTKGTLEDTERITGLINNGTLALQEIRLDDVEPRLNPVFQERLAWWTVCDSVGADGLKVLP